MKRATIIIIAFTLVVCSSTLAGKALSVAVTGVMENTFSYTVQVDDAAMIGETVKVEGIYRTYGEAGVIICGKYGKGRWANTYYYISPEDSGDHLQRLADHTLVLAELKVVDVEYYGYSYLVEIITLKDCKPGGEPYGEVFAIMGIIFERWAEIQDIDLASISSDIAVEYMQGYRLPEVDSYNEWTAELTGVDGGSAVLLYCVQGMYLPPQDNPQLMRNLEIFVLLPFYYSQDDADTFEYILDDEPAEIMVTIRGQLLE